MSYTRHIEFVKQEADTHPQSGESKNLTVIDAYFYDNHVVVWGWGTFDSFKLESDAVPKVRACLVGQGFHVLCETAKCKCFVCKELFLEAVVTDDNDIYVCDACEAFERGEV